MKRSTIYRRVFSARGWLALSVLASLGTTVWLFQLRREDAILREKLQEQSAEIETLQHDLDTIKDAHSDLERRVTSTESQFWE
jgi:hypothetical protein